MKTYEEGRSDMFAEIITKFEELHDEYIIQGDCDSANLVTDLVAWLQDDWEGISNTSFENSCKCQTLPISNQGGVNAGK